ncbi:hypothetical protein PCANC_17666 [Puccinia coronata f. sp. avenae]|uniref:Uncharacterized protein n=1 Tax=Puccinia coronata f. sp. avenae TaxID=200324 RepID=A0A2N5U982_9BASI|nr:hypothetical protein PCANC_17666 [Puccinia coronata f. sp. avenae]
MDGNPGKNHNYDLGYDHPPPENQLQDTWYNPNAYGGQRCYNESDHLPNGIKLANNYHRLGMGPNMRNWTLPTVPSLSVGNTHGNLACERSPAPATRYPGGDRTPAAERTPATDCTPAAERTPATERKPTSESMPAGEEHTPASNCLPAAERQAGHMIVQRASARKPNLTRAEIEATNELADIKRAEKARQMAANAKAKRQKTPQKEARAALKTVELPPEPRFLWTDNGSLEALQFVKALKEEFDQLSIARPGYIKWGPFVLKYTGKTKEDHFLIKELSNEVIFRRYNALITQYKVWPFFNS